MNLLISNGKSPPYWHNENATHKEWRYREIQFTSFCRKQFQQAFRIVTIPERLRALFYSWQSNFRHFSLRFCQIAERQSAALITTCRLFRQVDCFLQFGHFLHTESLQIMQQFVGQLLLNDTCTIGLIRISDDSTSDSHWQTGLFPIHLDQDQETDWGWSKDPGPSAGG